MASGSHDRTPSLTLVPSPPTRAEARGTGEERSGDEKASARDLDWSILMARAQGGDGEAYRRLLVAIAPYLRSLALRHHRDPGDVEDTVQDVLLTVHAIRHTYDPTRPFGPWLLAIARRRIIDQLRRQGRTRAREVALDLEETFSAPEAKQTGINASSETRSPACLRVSAKRFVYSSCRRCPCGRQRRQVACPSPRSRWLCIGR